MKKESRAITELAPNPKNPRQPFTPAQAEAFHKSLVEFGDLGGVVWNLRTKQLVGGHKRIEDFSKLETAQITITDRLRTPDAAGTVAVGYVHLHGTRYSYREVDWPPEKEAAANIAANQHGAEFDEVKLAAMLKELEAANFPIDLTGFSDKEISEFLRDDTVKDAEPQLDKADELRKKWGVELGMMFGLGKGAKCPKCGKWHDLK